MEHQKLDSKSSRELETSTLDELQLNTSRPYTNLRSLLSSIQQQSAVTFPAEESAIVQHELIAALGNALSQDSRHQYRIHRGDNKLETASWYCPAVELLPDPETPLGKVINSIKQEFPQLTVLISAELCVNHDNACAYLCGFVDTLFIQPEFIVTPERPGSNFESLLLLEHELGHARHSQLLHRGVSSPYQGSVSSSSGTVFDSLQTDGIFSGMKNYASGFQFDEVRQYAADDAFVAEHSQSSYFEKWEHGDFGYLRIERNKRVVDFARTEVLAIDSVIKTFRVNPDAIDLSISSDIVHNRPAAQIHDTTTGLTLNIPIPKAQTNYVHPESLEHLGNALLEKRNTALLHLVKASDFLIKQNVAAVEGLSRDDFIDKLGCTGDLELPYILRQRTPWEKRMIAFKDALYDIFTNR